MDWNYVQWYDAFGPYKLEGGQTLLLKAFTNFEPLELWPESKGFDPSTIYVYSVYDNVDMKLDYWSHLITRDNLPSKMRKLLVFEHGRLVNSLERLREIRKKIEQTAVEQGKKLKQMDVEELKQREVELHCYLYRDLFKLLELDWRPPSEMLEAVKGKPLLNVQYPAFETTEQKKQFWKKLFDPNDDFILGGMKI